MKRSFPFGKARLPSRLAVLFALSFAGLLFWSGPRATAQENVPEKPDEQSFEPDVSLVLSSIDRLMADLESAMSLTSAEEQKQTVKIKDYLDLTFKGMDYGRLLRLDFLAGEGPLRYRIAFPIDKLNDYFNQNLGPNGYQWRRTFGGLYVISGAFEGYMRIRNEYAIFAEEREDIPVLAPPPNEPKIQELLALTKDVAIKLSNVATPEAVKYRRKSFHNEEKGEDGEEKGLRKQLAKQIQKTKSESQNAFDARELAFEHQLDHLERLYVDVEKSLFLGRYDLEKKTLAFDFSLLPIPKTPTGKYVQSLNKEPLSFANIPKSAKSNMSLRVRMPMDEMHQRHFTETFELYRRIADEKVDESQRKSAEQKDATKKVIDLSYKLLLDNVKSGLADGFLEAHPNSDDTNTAIAGFKAADGNAPVEILKLLEKTREGQKVTMNLAEAGGVSIHSFLMSADEHPGYQKFFGRPEMYVGTSKDVIWLAAGPDAVEALKAAIGQVAKPNTGKASDPFLTISGHIAPWVKFHADNYPQSGTERFRKIRRLIVEAGEPGDNDFEIWFNRKDDEVQGKITGQPAWARFIGKFLADFAKNNIQDV